MNSSKSNPKTILVVIPARGGSKGIPKKNLSTLHGKTLTDWAIISALEIQYEKRIVLSSDSDEILDRALEYQGIIASKRPYELSHDYVADFEVLRHELSKVEALGSGKMDCVVMLQPTSPIRNPMTLNMCVSAVLAGHSSAWTVSQVPKKFHPRKQLIIEDQLLHLAVNSPLVVARQELNNTYIRTGACYAISRETVLSDKTLLGKNSLAVVSNWEGINIDEPADLIMAQEISKPFKGILIPKGES